MLVNITCIPNSEKVLTVFNQGGDIYLTSVESDILGKIWKVIELFKAQLINERLWRSGNNNREEISRHVLLGRAVENLTTVSLIFKMLFHCLKSIVAHNRF